MNKVYLITGKNCPNCNMLKKMLKLMKLEYDAEVDAYGETGGNYIAQVRARSIPVLVRVDGNGEVTDHVIGIAHGDIRFKEVCNGAG